MLFRVNSGITPKNKWIESYITWDEWEKRIDSYDSTDTPIEKLIGTGMRMRAIGPTHKISIANHICIEFRFQIIIIHNKRVIINIIIVVVVQQNLCSGAIVHQLSAGEGWQRWRHQRVHQLLSARLRLWPHPARAQHRTGHRRQQYLFGGSRLH